MTNCADCRFWRAPPPVPAEAEAVMLSRGVNRDGACHRHPRAERTAKEHWCGEWKAALRPVPEAT